MFHDTIPGSQTFINLVSFYQNKALTSLREKENNLRGKVERRLWILHIDGLRLSVFSMCSVGEGRGGKRTGSLIHSEYKASLG